MNIQFKKGVLELCLLSLLSNKDYLGYDLVKELCKNFKLLEGSIYPLLRRLTTEGYLDTYITEPEDGSPKKYYRITNKGRKARESLLDQWNNFSTRMNNLIKENCYNE